MPIDGFCPRCLSDEVRITADSFDYGRCGDTGYHDAGESASFECLRCGCVGEVEGDLVMCAPAEQAGVAA